ncbi:MAG: hemagglutinin [Bacteroidota bacterium]|nr:hemagglutinin [Bacteroidota bacterium]
MKKILLAFSILASLSSKAQIYNNSFENWTQDTFYLASGVINGIGQDTSYYSDPDQWTSSNAVTGLRTLGFRTLVSQSNNAHSGSSAIRMVTDSINYPIGGGATTTINLPGFALNGKFPLDPAGLIFGGGNTITPSSVKGAGQPFTQRLGAIRGFYNYTPVRNVVSGAYDTCLVYATLRRGTEIIANAIFKSTDSTGGYLPFSAPFTYLSCDMPDTLVILIASSVPNVLTIISGNSGLTKGSVFLLDSLAYDTLDPNYVFTPFAVNDLDTVIINTPRTVNVVANDADCNNSALTPQIISNATHGSAVVTNNNIVYTPNNNYVGKDTVVYGAYDPQNNYGVATLFLVVVNPAGISEANDIAVRMYPVPANNQLNVEFENPGKTYARVYDMIGNLVISSTLTGNTNRINTQNLTNGFYGIQIVDEKNTVLARAKFVVSK